MCYSDWTDSVLCEKNLFGRTFWTDLNQGSSKFHCELIKTKQQNFKSVETWHKTKYYMYICTVQPKHQSLICSDNWILDIYSSATYIITFHITNKYKRK
jgi:hypothetical protein